MHPMGHEPTTSLSIPLLWEKEVPIELWLIGKAVATNVLKTSIPIRNLPLVLVTLSYHPLFNEKMNS
jgi:hypothetical protein